MREGSCVCVFSQFLKSWLKKRKNEKGKGFRFRKRNNNTKELVKERVQSSTMKTTKGGKVMNPTDAYRKELRKKELKRVFFTSSIHSPFSSLSLWMSFCCSPFSIISALIRVLPFHMLRCYLILSASSFSSNLIMRNRFLKQRSCFSFN